MIRRKIADFFEAFLQKVFAHLLPGNFTERRVEKGPVVLAQESARNVLQRLFPPNRNGVFNAIKYLQKRTRVLHQERREYGSDGVRVVRQAAYLSAAVDKLAAFFVDAKQNELEMLFTRRLIDEAQKVEFAFAFGRKAAPRVASRNEEYFAEAFDGLCLEWGGECVQTPSADENALVDFMNQELAENRLRDVVTVGKFLGER